MTFESHRAARARRRRTRDSEQRHRHESPAVTVASSGPNPTITVPRPGRTVPAPGSPAAGTVTGMPRTRILVAAAGFGNAGGPASRAIIVTRDSESSRVTSQSRRETVTPAAAASESRTPTHWHCRYGARYMPGQKWWDSDWDRLSRDTDVTDCDYSC